MRTASCDHKSNHDDVPREAVHDDDDEPVLSLPQAPLEGVHDHPSVDQAYSGRVHRGAGRGQAGHCGGREEQVQEAAVARRHAEGR